MLNDIDEQLMRFIQKIGRIVSVKMKRFLQLNFVKSLWQCSAQATIEFSFAMTVAVLLLMGMIQIVVWTGKDLTERRNAHEITLMQNATGHLSQPWGLNQTEPTFYYSTPLEATVSSNIFGDADF